MILTILGCGTSTGVPLIQCRCSVCLSTHPKNTRLRCSAWIQTKGKNFIIDTSPDFRQQALRAKISRIDAVLFTHPHADHTHGIDDLRSYNFIQKTKIPVYGNRWTKDDLGTKFPYIFTPAPVEGGGIPMLEFREIQPESPFIDVLGEKIIPLPVPHGSKECLGYRLGSIAYVTDCNEIPGQTRARMEGLSTLILDCVQLRAHRTHLNLEKALEIASEINPKRTYLTHLGHEFDYKIWSKKLPKKVYLAYDGLTVQISDS